MKQTLFKTAFYPAFNCFVSLSNAKQDNGVWVFSISNDVKGVRAVVNESELNCFCL